MYTVMLGQVKGSFAFDLKCADLLQTGLDRMKREFFWRLKGTKLR